MIRFEVLDAHGVGRVIEVPGEINLSLMEVLRASGYDIAATCGGMALCATCYVEVLNGIDRLNQPGDIELDMLDTLPACTPQSRLACQVRVDDRLQNVRLRLRKWD